MSYYAENTWVVYLEDETKAIYDQVKAAVFTSIKI